MRISTLIAFLTITASSISATYPVFSQDIDEKGIARTTSLYFAIAEYCPSFFKLDGALARKLGEATYDLGIKTYGQKQFYDTAGTEFDRWKKEVEITGAYHWCDYQHSHQARVSGSKEANPFSD